MMDMRTLKILVCGSDEASMRRMARILSEEGVSVQTSNRLVDHLCYSRQEWDVMIIDLEGLNGFLRSLLPAFFRKFSDMPRIGISTTSRTSQDILGLGYGLELDAYLSEVPRPEELIVLFPELAAKYLYDDTVLRARTDNSSDCSGDNDKTSEKSTPVAFTTLLAGSL